MCGEPLTFDLTDDERAEVAAIARQRQGDAISFKEGMHLYEEGEVASFNRLGNHIMGEVAERLVSYWLLQVEEIEHDRPLSLSVEIREALSDITTKAQGLRLDVKASTSGEAYRFPQEQLSSSKSDAVVWCRMKRDQPFDYELEFDTVVPRGAKILGWSTMPDVQKSPLDSGYYRVVPPARCLASLLVWLRTGNSPKE